MSEMTGGRDWLISHKVPCEGRALTITALPRGLHSSVFCAHMKIGPSPSIIVSYVHGCLPPWVPFIMLDAKRKPCKAVTIC